MSKLQEQWAAEVLSYQSSGKSQMRYARERGISTAQLYYWVRKLSRNESEPKFVELRASPKVEVAVRKSALEIELSLPGGVVLRMIGT